MEKSLPVSDWSLVISLSAVIITLVGVAKVKAHRNESKLASFSRDHKKVLVAIQGAVRKPGEYFIEVGAVTVEQVLKKAKPSPYADLRRLNLKKIVDGPLKIEVAELEKISVFVTGAVGEAVELSLPTHSRISDLRSKVIFTDETDRLFFRRRKRLLNGDRIVVPSKKKS